MADQHAAEFERSARRRSRLSRRPTELPANTRTSSRRSHLRRGGARSRKRSGRDSRASSSGRGRGTACSTGSRRTRSGSSADKLNASVNCLDRHVRGARRNKAALIWEGEPGDRRTLTYFDLLPRGLAVRERARSRSASKKGDRVAHLHAARSPSSRSRCSRARASAPSTASSSAASAPSRCAIASTTRRRALLITADGGYRRGQIVPLKQIADEALAGTPSIEHVVVVQRGGGAPMPVHDEGGPRPLVSRADAGRAARVRARADGRRGHALHPLHVRHDREAEGHRPHDRRLSRRHLRDDEAGLRSAGTRTSTGARPTSAG